MNLVYIILAAGLSERFKSKNINVEKQFYLINSFDNSFQTSLISDYLQLSNNIYIKTLKSMIR